MKTYLIIGASSGIGLAIAKSLSEQGNSVYGTYHSTQSNLPSEIHFNHLNVLDSDLDISFLSESLDGLVYCPGSIQLKPFARIKPEQFADDYNLQFLGAVKVLQAALPKLRQGESPSVVFFSTVAVQNGFNFHSLVSSSKGAIEGLTRALSAELAPTIRVNCIAPSLTNTPLAASMLNSDSKLQANNERHPLKRVGEASDIASMAEFLLSEKASWITGQVMHVDGGMSTIK
jgi:NAD(P)-dependent dehydrogenase (short-subunit alcohol dehydrogenase family)